MLNLGDHLLSIEARKLGPEYCFLCEPPRQDQANAIKTRQQQNSFDLARINVSLFCLTVSCMRSPNRIGKHEYLPAGAPYVIPWGLSYAF